MTVELVSGYGIRMGGLPDVPFGMSRDEVLTLLAAHRRLHEPFVCGASWAYGWLGDGVTVDVYGGHDLLSAGFQIGRRSTYYIYGREELVAHQPVVYSGVDLFGWPSGDVIGCLRSDGFVVEALPQMVRVGTDLTLFRWAQPEVLRDAVVFDHVVLTYRLPIDNPNGSSN